MSDLSSLEQSFGLLPATMVPPLADDALDETPPSTDLQPHEIRFRRLRGPQEISRVLHLREEIRLPSSARGDASFATREKKETNWVS